MIITIDGPAGSGKSTAARKLAARLGIAYLDTGAMFRVVTLAALGQEIDLHDEEALTGVAGSGRYELDLGPTHIRVTLDGRDVTEELRSMRVNDCTRYIAASPGVRRLLIEGQRRIARERGALVTEGRDQGSVAFPDADLKFYMDARVGKRAERRMHELIADGQDVTLEQVLDNVRERDRTDAARPVAPLRAPDGAVHIDSTDLSISEVVDLMLEHVRSAGLLEVKHDTPSGQDS